MKPAVLLGGGRYASLVRVIGFVLLLPFLLTACSTSKAPSNTAVGELNKVAPLKRGEAALVFVYTDG